MRVDYGVLLFTTLLGTVFGGGRPPLEQAQVAVEYNEGAEEFAEQKAVKDFGWGHDSGEPSPLISKPLNYGDRISQEMTQSDIEGGYSELKRNHYSTSRDPETGNTKLQDSHESFNRMKPEGKYPKISKYPITSEQQPLEHNFGQSDNLHPDLNVRNDGNSYGKEDRQLLTYRETQKNDKTPRLKNFIPRNFKYQDYIKQDSKDSSDGNDDQSFRLILPVADQTKGQNTLQTLKTDDEHRRYYGAMNFENNNLQHASKFGQEHLNKPRYGYGTTSDVNSAHSRVQNSEMNLYHASGNINNKLNRHNHGSDGKSVQHSKNSRSFENNFQPTPGIGQDHVNKHNHGYAGNSGSQYVNSQAHSSDNHLHHASGFGENHLNKHNSGYGHSSGLHSDNSQVRISGNHDSHHAFGIGQSTKNKMNYPHQRNSGLHSAISQAQNSGKNLHQVSRLSENSFNNHNYGHSSHTGLNSLNSQSQSSGEYNLQNKHHNSRFGQDHSNKHNHGYERDSSLRSTNSRGPSSGNNLHQVFSYGDNHLNKQTYGHGSKSGQQSITSLAQSSGNGHVHHASRFGQDHIKKNNNGYQGVSALHPTQVQAHNSGYKSGLINSRATTQNTPLRSSHLQGDHVSANRGYHAQSGKHSLGHGQKNINNGDNNRAIRVLTTKGAHPHYRYDSPSPHHNLNNDEKHSHDTRYQGLIPIHNFKTQHGTQNQNLDLGANKQNLGGYSRHVSPSHKLNHGGYSDQNEHGNHYEYKDENEHGIGEINQDQEKEYIPNSSRRPIDTGYPSHSKHTIPSASVRNPYTQNTKKSPHAVDEYNQRPKPSIKTRNPSQSKVSNKPPLHSDPSLPNDHSQNSPNTKDLRSNRPQLVPSSGVKGSSGQIIRPHFKSSSFQSPNKHHEAVAKKSEVPATEQKELLYEDVLGEERTPSGSKSAEPHPHAEQSQEALLGGGRNPNHGDWSSGFSYPGTLKSSDDKYEESRAMPYEFRYEVKDEEKGANQYREEKMDDAGMLTGRYGYMDGEGIFRHVEYQAGKEGFKVSNIKTNEPGTSNADPANVHFEVQGHPTY